MTIELGKLVYDDGASSKLVYDDHSSGKLVFCDQQIFSTPLGPATSLWRRIGTSVVSMADAFANMQAASWTNTGFASSFANTVGLLVLPTYSCILNASRYRNVLPNLGTRTVKSVGLQVTNVGMTGAKLTLAASLYSAWADIIAAPSVDLTATGWVDIDAADALGDWMIVYAEAYAVGDVAEVDGNSVRITIE